ncbi:MAG: hypothetical protein MI748_10390, partial [Opitutales bacterium]|nr:hypothetical protein [Opitutales bacterium]
FPLGNLKILHEMMRMLKKGGILTNIYEPHVYYDNSFNWKNDLYFLEVFLAPLSGRGVFFDRPVQEVFSPHEILSDPDTYIDADVSSVGQFKMINSWTALGYIGRKTQDLPRSFATHYDFGKNRCYTDVEHQLKEISIEKLSTLKASEIRILGSDARIMAIKEIFKLQFPMVEYVGYSDLLEKIEKGDAVSDKRTVVVDPFFFLFRDRFFLELLKQESLYVLSELRCSQNLNLETKIRKFNRLLTALNIESFAILGNGGHTQQVLDIMKELGVDRNYQIYVSEISDFQGKDIKCLESGPVEESILLLSSESYEKEMISLLQRNGQMDECFVFPLYHLNKIKALGDSRHAQ